MRLTIDLIPFQFKPWFYRNKMTKVAGFRWLWFRVFFDWSKRWGTC